MRPPASSLLNKIMRKRGLVWAASLMIILAFLGVLGAIFWFTRVIVSYPAEITARETDPGTRGREYRVTIPRQSFQSVKPGDRATITPDGGDSIEGEVLSLRSAPASITLTIACETGREEVKEPSGKMKGTVTLRARRLISTFSRRPTSPPPADSSSPDPA